MSRESPESPSLAENVPISSSGLPNPRLTRALHAILPAALSLLLFGWTLDFGFAFDDGVEIVDNRFVHSWENLPRLLTSWSWTGSGLESPPMYRPLTSVSYLANYSLGGLSPWSYHAVNVVLHALVAWLVVAVGNLWNLPSRGVLVGALLFAAHPIHVEAVANVAGRKDLLATLFILVTLLAHSRARRGPWNRVALPWVALACALLSKEVGLVTVALLGLNDLLRPNQKVDRPRLVTLYSGYAVVLSAYLLLRWKIVGGLWAAEVPFVDNPIAAAPVAIRIATALGALARGLALLVAPLRLSPDYSFAVIRPEPSIFGWALAGFAIAGLLVGWILWRWRRDRRAWLLAGLYLLPLLPSANLLTPIGSIFGERFLYLPSVAFCLAAGTALAAATERLPRLPATALLVVPIVLLAARSVAYTRHWRDDAHLFAYARTAVPESLKVHVKWGEVLQSQGRHDEALAAYEQALRILPGEPFASLKAAFLLDEMGRLPEAEGHYRVLLSQPPANAAILYQLGVSRRVRGRLDEAATWWRRTIRLQSNHALALGDLGSYHLVRGELDRAKELLERAAAADPSVASTHYNLSLVLEQLGDRTAAESAFARYRQLADTTTPHGTRPAE